TPQWLEKLDSFNFTAHVILTLLTRPEDAKPDNFMTLVEKDELGQVSRIKLVGIDNDLSFGEPILNSRTGHYLALKSVFFLLPHMDQPLDAGFRQLFLKQSPALLVMKWLKSLLIKESDYQRYKVAPISTTQDIDSAQFIRTLITEEEFSHLNLPIK